MAWEKMYKSKREGGMGFRNSQVFDKALLAKQSWRVMAYEDSLMVKVLKGKYFPSTYFMKATVPPNASFTYSSIMLAKMSVMQAWS